jgi:hypothetical protein
VDGNGSGSYSVTGFGISGAKPWISAARELVTSFLIIFSEFFSYFGT